MTEITINIVTHNNQYGLSNDASLLVKTLQEVSKVSGNFTFQVRPVSYFAMDCGTADVNIFLEVPNPNLIHQAKVNVLVPNNEWFYRHWQPYLNLFDCIWCKSESSYQEFKKMCPQVEVCLLGWSSIDRLKEVKSKDFSRFLHVAGRSELKGTQRLLNYWEQDWPNLTVVYNSQHNTNLIEKNQSNISYLRERLSDDRLRELMNISGVHICPSEAEGFGHYLNEARSCQSIVVTTATDPMKQFAATSTHLLSISETTELAHTFAKKHLFCKNSLKTCINTLQETSTNQFTEWGKEQRQRYLADKKTFRKQLQTAMGKVLRLTKKPTYPKIPKEIQSKVEDFPTVSIVTLLHNRPKFFPLALMNYLGTDYPRSKLEWIIVDDSHPDLQVKDSIPSDDKSIHYHTLDTPTTIAEKRNLGVSKSQHSVIAFMDDDDIYQPRHLLVRLAYMNHYQKACSYASGIGCFHIGKLISTMNVPPLQYPPEYRCSEATLTFHKSFWEEKGFSSTDTNNEGRHFLQGRYHQCVEVPYKPIIVSLLHSDNISNRAKNIGDEPNGCHFGLSDELFQFITSLETSEE